MPFSIKNPSRLVIGILLALFFGVALFIRIYYSYNAVFVGDWIKFTSNDAYYQMRLVDLIAHNFPHLDAFDPYLIFPGGASYGSIHFFNWLIALVIQIVSFGNPSQHTIDIIGVYTPVVLAALTVIPVYFIGKALFNKWAGVIAAGLVAVMPGEFVGRSILGGTDQHIAETLFTTIAAMFLIYALKTAWKNQVAWANITKRDLKPLILPLIYSLLAGLFIGIYNITWTGAPLFLFIITVYFVIQFIIDLFKKQSSFYLGFTGFFTMLPAFIIFAFFPYTVQKLVLLAALLIPLVLAALSWLITRAKLKPLYSLLALIGLAALGLVIFRLVDPYYFNAVFSMLTVFIPGGPTGTTTIEMQPFLAPSGTFNIAVAWGNFTTSFFLIPWAPIPGFAIIALVVLIVLYIKNRSDDKPILLFFIWTLVIFIATLMQRRFAYYLVVNMSLLTAYLGWQLIWWFSKRRRHLENPETLSEQYQRARFVGVLGGLIAFAASFILLALSHIMYFFVPVFIASVLAIFYGFWAWVKLKGLNDYMILWAFVFPLGIPIIAFLEGQTPKAKPVKGSVKKKQLNLNAAAAGNNDTKTKSKSSLNPWLYRFNIATLVVIVFVSAFWTNFRNAKEVAAAATYAPSDAWEETLHWIKDNTPVPMDINDYYKFISSSSGSSFVYPATTYGVTAWWDYGYWITRTAQRIPSANPSQEPGPIKNVANLLLSQDDQKAKELMETLKSSYVVLDEAMTTSKIWAVMVWAGVDSDKYVQIYYYLQGNQLIPVQVYTLDYYKLLSVRLFNFNGKASTSEKPMVLTWDNKKTSTGATVRVVSNAQEFDSYQQALDYVNANQGQNLTITGSSPFVNPVPMQAVPGFDLVFSSTMNNAEAVNAGTAELKVFQYSGN